MAGLTDPTVLLRGGSHDGESTTVAPEVTRLLTPSEAPGLLDVYEATGETMALRGNDVDAVVFQFVSQQPADGVTPELLHMP